MHTVNLEDLYFFHLAWNTKAERQFFQRCQPVSHFLFSCGVQLYMGGLLMKLSQDRHCSVFCFQSCKEARIPQGMTGTLKGRRGEALVGRPQPADGGLLPGCRWPTHCTARCWGCGAQAFRTRSFSQPGCPGLASLCLWKAHSHPQGRRTAVRWAVSGLS